jgi:serine/threonine-protein kinase
VVVGQAQWNTPIPVDPGDVTVEASAPGRKTWRGSVSVAARAPGQLEVPALESEPVASVPASAAEPRSKSDPPAAPAPAPSGAQRTIAVVAGAAGVVALGVGSVFGLVSAGKKSDADKHCDGANVCDDEGLGLRRDAISAGTISTVGFVAGGVLAAAGVVLWVTAPRRTPATGMTSPGLRAGVSPRWGGLAFQMELP